MTLDSELDLDFNPPNPNPPKKQNKTKQTNRGLLSMMINTHMKFESNRTIRT